MEEIKLQTLIFAAVDQSTAPGLALDDRVPSE